MATLLKDIVGNVQQIIRAEVRLAKVEVAEQASRAKRGIVLIAAGGILATLALGLVLLGAVYLLGHIVPSWVAAVAVGVATGAIGGTLILIGVRQLSLVSLPPPRTVTSVQENIQWAKAQAR